jgi:hypothetical protein
MTNEERIEFERTRHCQWRDTRVYSKTELFEFADYCMTHSSGFTPHETESKFQSWLKEKFDINSETFKKEMFGQFKEGDEY